MVLFMTKTLEDNKSLIQYLEFDNTNVYVVGDIHGCYSLLMSNLNNLNFDFSKDILISVGDLVDRGSENLPCLTLLDEPWFYMIRGNHEQMCITSSYDRMMRDVHYRNGGQWFYEIPSSLQENIRSRFSKIPIVIELLLNKKKYGFVHADIEINNWELFKIDILKGDYKVAGVRSSIKSALWGRNRIKKYDPNLYDYVEGIDQIFLGHTILKDPIHLDNCTYIDTGAFWTNTLTIIKLT